MKTTLQAAAIVVALGAGTAQAGTVDLSYDLDVAYQTVNGVRSDTSTYSSDLIGSVFTATYTDGTVETSIWQRFTTWTSGIRSIGIDIAYRWWGLEMTTTSQLASLSIDLAPAGTIFDAQRFSTGHPDNTPTTKGGSPLRLIEYGTRDDDNTSLDGVVKAQYSGLVQLAGYAPGRDAFTRLNMDFSGIAGGGLLGAVTLGMDTDVIEGGVADLTPIDVVPVPLPAGILLLLTALAGFLSLRSFRQQQPVRQLT